MAVHGGADIVNDGLKLCVDGASKNCYPGSGTTVTDLSNGKSGTMSGVTHSDNTFLFDASGEDIDFASNADFAYGTSFTYEYWIKPSSIGTYAAIIDPRTSGEMLAPSIWIGTTSGYKYYIWINNTRVINHDTDWQTNQWQYGATVYNGSTMKLYYGLSEVASTSYSSTMIQSKVRIGNHYNDQYPFSGNISIVRAYNKALSLTELTQNYNAQRGRFGV